MAPEKDGYLIMDEDAASFWVATQMLRWKEIKDPLRIGVELQQAWQSSRGKIEWRTIETVPADAPDKT